MVKSLEEKVEDVIREALGRMPELRNIPERQYCEVVADGLDLVLIGINMRLDELDPEDTDEDES